MATYHSLLGRIGLGSGLAGSAAIAGMAVFGDPSDVPEALWLLTAAAFHYAVWHFAKAKGQSGWWVLLGCPAWFLVPLLPDRSNHPQHRPPVAPPPGSLSFFIVNTWYSVLRRTTDDDDLD